MVWNLNEYDRKILKILYEDRQGLRAKTIMNLLGLKRSHLYKRMSYLKDKGLVYSEFPLWKIVNGQVKFVESLFRDNKIFEIHNLGYVVPLPRIPNWWNTRKNRLIRLKNWIFKSINWGKNASNPYMQLSNDKYVIQTFPESLIIIHRKRYYSNDPYDTFMQFMDDFYDLMEWFEERMKFKFFIDGVPQLKLRSSDFNRLNDALANHCKKKGKGFLVEIEGKGKVWVDFSEPFGKEANYPEAQEILEKDIKDKLLNKPMLNSELQMMVQNIVQNQVIFDRNIVKHQEVLEEMSKTLKKIQESLDR